MTNCSLILVALFLIGLGLGDSPLVILSLCSLVLFVVISSGLLRLFLLFSLLFFSLFVSLSVLFRWPYLFLRFFNIFFLLIKKKKEYLQLFQLEFFSYPVVGCWVDAFFLFFSPSFLVTFIYMHYPCFCMCTRVRMYFEYLHI